MTIDRYIYVAHPFENITWRKPKTVFLLSLFIWLREFFIFIRRIFFSITYLLVSCALASPFYFHYGITYEYHKQCVLLTDENVQRQFRIYTVTLYYFIPLIIILICYTRLLYYVYSKEKKLQPKTVEFSQPFFLISQSFDFR
jgi:glucan phosphoethanolaminetransferase (alkaline phosphatase superfamily)